MSRWWWAQLEKRQGEPSPRRVLVADDDAAIAATLDTILRRRLGCDVTLAATGDEALMALERRPADVILADMMMPGVHGLELISTVRKRHPYTDIVVLTGFSEDFPYVEVVMAGAKDIIAKPCSNAELEAKLLRVFQERDLQADRARTEAKYRSIFDLNTEGMAIIDGGTLTVVDANEAMYLMTRRPKDGLVGIPASELFEQGERDRFKRGVELCARSNQGVLGDLSLVKTDNTTILVDVTMTFVSLLEENLICLAFKDVTDKSALEQTLADAAQHDELTGLFNRRAFQTRLETALARSRGAETPLALVLIDVDNFKQCNDSHGHQVGDHVLRSVGRCIQASIRSRTDDGFRYGGDEFAVILSGGDASVALHIAERLRKQFEHIENYGTSLSVGIAEYQKDMHSTALLRHADEALYRAKALGKNYSCVA